MITRRGAQALAMAVLSSAVREHDRAFMESSLAEFYEDIAEHKLKEFKIRRKKANQRVIENQEKLRQDVLTYKGELTIREMAEKIGIGYQRLYAFVKYWDLPYKRFYKKP